MTIPSRYRPRRLVLSALVAAVATACLSLNSNAADAPKPDPAAEHLKSLEADREKLAKQVDELSKENETLKTQLKQAGAVELTLQKQRNDAQDQAAMMGAQLTYQQQNPTPASAPVAPAAATPPPPPPAK